MRRSKNYNMRLPQRGTNEGEVNDPADIDDLTYDVELIDTEMQRQQLEDERLEKDKATKKALSEHAAATPLGHPDGSVTDDKLGNRTVITTTGKLQALLTAIGSAIKAITGTDIWDGAPATTLKAAKAHMDDRANIHAVTKAQVGLANADNTSDKAKPVSTAQAAAIQLVQTDVTAHKNNAVAHITQAERELWNNAGSIAPGSNIDCGTFVDTIDDIMAHNEAMYTHNDMVFDGNTEALSTPPYDLETHSVDTYAHQNLIVDGNK